MAEDYSIKPTPEEYGYAVLEEAMRRLFGESLPRIKRCLIHLSEEEVWFRPNEETVSVGNLVLHLCGNVRQWIISCLGGEEDTRDRDSEFSEKGPIPTDELIAKLDETMTEVEAVLTEVDPVALLARVTVQGMEETVLTVIVHVVEHFSYHTGQITYAVKSRIGIDLGYYEGLDLNAKNT